MKSLGRGVKARESVLNPEAAYRQLGLDLV